MSDNPQVVTEAKLEPKVPYRLPPEIDYGIGYLNTHRIPQNCSIKVVSSELEDLMVPDHWSPSVSFTWWKYEDRGLDIASIEGNRNPSNQFGNHPYT